MTLIYVDILPRKLEIMAKNLKTMAANTKQMCEHFLQWLAAFNLYGSSKDNREKRQFT